MSKIYYDGEIKIVDHGKWQEWIWPFGFKYNDVYIICYAVKSSLAKPDFINDMKAMK